MDTVGESGGGSDPIQQRSGRPSELPNEVSHEGIDPRRFCLAFGVLDG
jgi:hypothetical protein